MPRSNNGCPKSLRSHFKWVPLLRPSNTAWTQCISLLSCYATLPGPHRSEIFFLTDGSLQFFLALCTVGRISSVSLLLFFSPIPYYLDFWPDNTPISFEPQRLWKMAVSYSSGRVIQWWGTGTSWWQRMIPLHRCYGLWNQAAQWKVVPHNLEITCTQMSDAMVAMRQWWQQQHLIAVNSVHTRHTKNLFVERGSQGDPFNIRYTLYLLLQCCGVPWRQTGRLNDALTRRCTIHLRLVQKCFTQFSICPSTRERKHKRKNCRMSKPGAYLPFMHSCTLSRMLLHLLIRPNLRPKIE